MSQTIELKVPKDITKLAGYLLGETLYASQVKTVVNLSENIVLVFPAQTDGIASSFVQGFFKEIKMQIGITGIEKQFDFQSSSIPNIKDFILKNLT